MASDDRPAESRESPTLAPPDETGLGLVELGWDLNPDARFYRGLKEHAKRAELLATLLTAGAFDQEEGLFAVRATLLALGRHARECGIFPLEEIATSLAASVRAIVGSTHTSPAVDVVVVDPDEVSRSLVAIRMEALGYTVRACSQYGDLVTCLSERIPEIVIYETEQDEALALTLCRTLKELCETYPDMRLVVFSSADAPTLAEHAKASAAALAVTKDSGLDELVAQIRLLAQRGSDLPPSR
jgi:CheY-like chemotaxis protein